MMELDIKLGSSCKVLSHRLKLNRGGEHKRTGSREHFSSQFIRRTYPRKFPVLSSPVEVPREFNLAPNLSENSDIYIHCVNMADALGKSEFTFCGSKTDTVPDEKGAMKSGASLFFGSICVRPPRPRKGQFNRKIAFRHNINAVIWHGVHSPDS